MGRKNDFESSVYTVEKLKYFLSTSLQLREYVNGFLKLLKIDLRVNVNYLLFRAGATVIARYANATH